MRPPDAAFGEDADRWLDARADRGAPRSVRPAHALDQPDACPSDRGDPAERVRKDADWLREQALEPRYFCGGGWYTDEEVRSAVRELGLVDCTERDGAPEPGVLPTTHSLGQLARAVLGPLPQYVHAYFHDYDLLDPTRRSALHRLAACPRTPT